ncbi:MAG: TetR/AcrR family transcriptional regulator [Chloroflexota bacterium]
MRNKKEDRRSTRTRLALHQAIIELMQEKQYETITIQDIIDRANVGRSTFYAHYQDKEDLVNSNVTSILDELGQHLEGYFRPGHCFRRDGQWSTLRATGEL